MKYLVNTNFNEELISQEVLMEAAGIRESITRQVIHLQEEGIREALIKLGWTPPSLNERNRRA